MQEQYKAAFEALEDNIIEVIKEEQIKIGYKEETIRLYYPLESICNLLGNSYTTTKIHDILEQFCEFTKGKLGEVTYSNKGTRFCFIIPPSGVNYVHEKAKDNYFLKEFIETMTSHDCDLDKILNVFHKYSDKVTWCKMDNGEFDYLIYFEDGEPDHYKYCVKFEECHAIYHRFTKVDYEGFGF